MLVSLPLQYMVALLDISVVIPVAIGTKTVFRFVHPEHPSKPFTFGA